MKIALPTPVTTSVISSESWSMRMPKGMVKPGSEIQATDSSNGSAEGLASASRNNRHAQRNESNSPVMAKVEANRLRWMLKSWMRTAEASGAKRTIQPSVALEAGSWRLEAGTTISGD